MFLLRDLRFVLCLLGLDVLLRKGLWAFYHNYPQFNEVRKSDHMTDRKLLRIVLHSICQSHSHTQ